MTPAAAPARPPVAVGEPMAKPVAPQPEAVSPGAVSPGAVQPGTVQPGTVQPAAGSAAASVRAWCAESAPPGAVVAAGFGRCRLSAGERPPQFVVLSFDGAGVDSQGWFPVFREAAAKVHASMTFFLSGVYLLPQEKRKLYHPPGHLPGSSDIGFQRRSRIGPQIAELTKAYNAGHEIGTHFNGHFCGSDGVRSWSAADWRQEIEQFYAMVTNW